MMEVKVLKKFRLKNGRVFEPDKNYELTEKEVKAVQKQLGNDFLEVIREIEGNDIDFNAMNVDEIENWLKEQNVEFDPKAKKPEKVKLAEEKASELKEQEENAKE